MAPVQTELSYHKKRGYMNEILDQRAQQILKILVERYIYEGVPIGSKTLSEEYALNLSPASIRNILADLEEEGYLKSPHTSAGRIPTEQGYRCFVNSLLTVKPLDQSAIQELKNQLSPDLNLPGLLQSASSVLSTLTGMTGVVSLPKRNRVEFQQVEFLPLSGNRILVILIFNNHEVQNRIIHTDKGYTRNELQEISNYLNFHYKGKDLLDIRTELLVDMKNDRDNMIRLFQAAIDLANKAFSFSEEGAKDYVVAGQANLFNCANESDLDHMRSLFEAFTQKQKILNLLNYALEAEGIQIFIGKESGYEVFDRCSIVAASYSTEGQIIGTLGVIGPTRMPYDRVISAVDVTAKLLSAALNHG